jgi:UDP-N-acetylglucosamine 2-epimerase (non-hydrolysing)
MAQFCLVRITECGTNRLVGRDLARIVAAWREICDAAAPPARVPPLWDGRAAERIADALLRAL